jgi:hypothetical protein
VSRPAVAVLVSVVFVLAVSAVQWLVTSPGRITYGECRLLILAGVPALVTTLSAAWIDDARRDR